MQRSRIVGVALVFVAASGCTAGSSAILPTTDGGRHWALLDPDRAAATARLDAMTHPDA